MGETANSEGSTNEPEKPVPSADVFPPFPKAEDADFDEDISTEERNYYKNKFTDLHDVKSFRLHCTACDRHLGCSAKNENRMRAHPMLRTLVCHTCHTFYNSGEFDKGDDGSELYCRWCGQGGQVYCCSDCPHVFCAKCIKRNLGMAKIKEIENTDDWKCFKCNPNCIWDLRALCWALLRYCDLKNKMTYTTQDPVLKETYQKDCAQDHSECCRYKARRKTKEDTKKKIDDKKDPDFKKSTSSIIPKIPPTIQVKKFASMVDDSVGKPEKKPQKRSVSPKMKQIFMKSPINISTGPGPAKLMNPMAPANKKMKMGNSNFIQPVRFGTMEKKPISTYGRVKPVNIRPAPIQMPIMHNNFNGFNNINTFYNDNINLSLESLTQGLDMASVTSLGNNGFQNDVVCTPDFPLEPLCEVTEDNTDDDVQCITPGPVAIPKLGVNTNTPPPLLARSQTFLSDVSSDNIIQMTENDVTVNAATGGLKFRVDPQTLSSNKMYRLPDGRIFAINANPAMPGGYSATIVAVTETVPGKVAPTKGPTYAAKLSAVTTPASQSTPVSKANRGNTRTPNSRTRTPKSKVNKVSDNMSSRSYDVDVPVEWFRYNLLDAVDSLEYSLSKLHKIKKEATSMYLRSRTILEMKTIHKSLDRLLNTSSTRFNEIRQNLNKEMKQYLTQKKCNDSDDDDDDVEILNDGNDNDDPIFIDENSVDSNVNDTICTESHEVDLTTVASDHNDSTESMNKEYSKNDERKDDDRSEPSVIENKTLDESNENNDDKVTDEKESTDDNVEQEKQCEEKTTETNEKLSIEDENKGVSNDEDIIQDKEITSDEKNAVDQAIINEDEDTTDKAKDLCDGEESVDKDKEESKSVEKNTPSEEEPDSEMTEVAREKSSKELDEEMKLLNEDRPEVCDTEKIQDADMDDEMIDNLLSEETAKEEILGT